MVDCSPECDEDLETCTGEVFEIERESTAAFADDFLEKDGLLGDLCGNGLREGDEACDADYRLCSDLTTSRSGAGRAFCKPDCTGYDLSACLNAPFQTRLEGAITTITADALQTQVKSLTMDKFNGREAGTPGEQMVLDYLTAKFEEFGLRPGLLNGYQQPFPWNDKTSNNIIGVLDGNDPNLRDEMVLIGAHYDGQGTTQGKLCKRNGNGSICPGADDNASGASAVLLIAKALAQLKGQNRRTLVFVLFGAEEKGLLGSKYFVEQPLFQMDKVVYMINLDMIGHAVNHTVNALGAASSTWASEEWQKTAVPFGLVLSITDDAGSGSDHYPFALKGVPHVFFFTGFHDCYHATCDSVDRFNLNTYADITRMVVSFFWHIAQVDENPRKNLPTIQKNTTSTSKVAEPLGVFFDHHY